MQSPRGRRARAHVCALLLVLSSCGAESESSTFPGTPSDSGGSGGLGSGGAAPSSGSGGTMLVGAGGARISMGTGGAPGTGGSHGSQSDAAVSSDAALPISDAGSMMIDFGPPPADFGAWQADGPIAATTQTGTGPSNMFTIWRPTTLGQGGMLHPIVLWGSGVGQAPSGYQSLLEHWATFGMVVISPTGTNPGSGVDQQMLDGLDWLIMENQRAGSDFEGKLKIDRIASTGHSNGAIASVVAASTEPRITTTVVVAGGDVSIYSIRGPILLVGNENDILVNPANLLAPQFETTHAPTVYGIKKGVGHGEVMGSGGSERAPITAWLVGQLFEDKIALAAFYADDCTLCKDTSWIVERKLIPGLEPPLPPTVEKCMGDAMFPGGLSADCKACLCTTCPTQAVACTDDCWSMVGCMVNTCNTDDLGNYACATGTCSGNAAGYRGCAALSIHGYDCMAPGKCLAKCYP